ncbi:MAG: hypothetical protein V1798_01705 [Pseudomonadota bacterium]
MKITRSFLLLSAILAIPGLAGAQKASKGTVDLKEVARKVRAASSNKLARVDILNPKQAIFPSYSHWDRRYYDECFVRIEGPFADVVLQKKDPQAFRMLQTQLRGVRVLEKEVVFFAKARLREPVRVRVLGEEYLTAGGWWQTYKWITTSDPTVAFWKNEPPPFLDYSSVWDFEYTGELAVVYHLPHYNLVVWEKTADGIKKRNLESDAFGGAGIGP